MKLVLIQGNKVAQYIGRAQGPVVQVASWEFDAKEWVEDFRQHGAEAC